mmetsp:Transcript_4968/g.13152  ORF Transcript_4968/g.13152 Transcript_4968/m.13152 type:complete len:217 (-) Transcript_4968:1124-1774(-)
MDEGGEKAELAEPKENCDVLSRSRGERPSPAARSPDGSRPSCARSAMCEDEPSDRARCAGTRLYSASRDASPSRRTMRERTDGGCEDFGAPGRRTGAWAVWWLENLSRMGSSFVSLIKSFTQACSSADVHVPPLGAHPEASSASPTKGYVGAADVSESFGTERSEPRGSPSISSPSSPSPLSFSGRSSRSRSSCHGSSSRKSIGSPRPPMLRSLKL